MYTKIYTSVDFVISVILWILIGLFIVPLIFLLFLYKSFVIFLAGRVDKHLHPTHPNDTYFAVGDTTQVPIVNVAQIWRLEGYLPLEEFKSLFQSLFLSCPESRKNYLNLYCYLVRFGGYIFKKSVAHLDIDKHVGIRELGAGDNLEQFIVKWMVEEKFGRGKPLWEIVLIYLPVEPEVSLEKQNDNDKLINNNGEEAKKEKGFETVVLFKLHHCLTDGYGFIHMVDKLTGNEAPYLVQEEEESVFQKVT